MVRRFPIWHVIAFLAAGAIVSATEGLSIVPIMRNDQLLVSLELTDGYTDEVDAAVSSGLRTTFTYYVELRMAVPAWLDRTIVTAVVSTSDQYDNLTRRHSLSRTVDGRVEEALVTEDHAVARRWLTTLTRLPVCRTSKLDPSRDYYVRISAQARPHSASLLGWVHAITGQAKFTFIP